MSAIWARAAIGLGSNLGDRRGSLDSAAGAIAALAGVRVLAISRWIETQPVGTPPGSPAFLNGAMLVETRLPPRALLIELQAIERAHGRERGEAPRNAPRVLDLDLLVHGGERIDAPDLQVPHPRLSERRFVLEPLAEIAPDLALPSGRTVAELLVALPA